MGCRKLSYYEGEGTKESSSLKICRAIEKNPVSSFFCVSYTPFGGAFSSYQRVGNQQNKYKYNGKELITDLDLNLYDYGVRFYDPAIGRFATIDPFANQRDWLTPYNYVQNNPILRLDPDGQDYGLKFNHADKTVTVSATYYTTEGSTEAAQSSAENLNGQSGENTFVVGKGDAAVTYTVNFEISVTEVEVDSNLGEVGSLNQALSNDKSGEGNVFMVVDDSRLDENTNGRTTGGNFIQVKESRANAETGAHEIGHTLGLTHQNKGLMTAGSTDSRRGLDLIRGDVKDMIKYPMKGEVNSENGNSAGRGTVKNSTPIHSGGNDYSSQGFQRVTSAPEKLQKGKVKRKK